MKRLNLFYGASALAAILMAAPVSVNAQENGNRDEFGNIVRGPYETNQLGDNWFVGIGGGINFLLNDGYDTKAGPSLDINFGKWVTPSVGMRAGYQGLSFNTIQNSNDQKYGYTYLHGDLLWNASNAISGYKETRFWDLIPYLHAGYFRSHAKGGADFTDNEFATGFGLLHDLQLTDNIAAIIDMRATIVKGTVHGASGAAILPSITAGFAMDLGWNGFVRTSTIIGALESVNAESTAVLETAIVALEAANAALESENMSLKKKNNDLNKTVKNLKAVEAADEQAFMDLQPITLYFQIGQAVLDEMELQHLDFFASKIIEKVNSSPNADILIMGSADSNTGNAKRNAFLSEARGKYITSLLTEKYGISKDKINVKSEVVNAKAKPQMNRAVIITFK